MILWKASTCTKIYKDWCGGTMSCFFAHNVFSQCFRDVYIDSWVPINFEGARESNTLTSKKALLKELPHTPLATISRRAPSWVLVVARRNISDVIGWSEGSIATPWQVSERREAVKSLSSLWRIDGYPPFGQNNTCCTKMKGWSHEQWGVSGKPAISQCQSISKCLLVKGEVMFLKGKDS